MTATSTRPVRGRRRFALPRRRLGRPTEGAIWLALLVIASAVQSVVVLRLVRTSWFGVDALYYVATRGPIPRADEGLFRPYGGHWQTIPLLVYRGLFAVFGLRTYVPYVGLALTLHLAIVFVMFALLRSVGAHVRTAAVTAGLLLFYGGGAEAFMWDAPMVLTSGLLLGLIAALVLVRSDFSTRSQVVAAVLLLGAVMCSGTGLVAATTVGCFAFLRAGVRGTLIVSGPATLAFTVWFYTIGRDGRVHFSPRSIPEVPGYVWSGLTGSLGSVVGVPVTGWILLLLLAGAVALAEVRTEALRQLAVAGIAGAVTQLTLSSFASLLVSDQAARVSRYQYIVLVLLAASIALALEAAARAAGARTWTARLVPLAAVVVLAVAIGHGITLERRQADYGASSAILYKTWVFGGLEAADAGEKQLVQDASSGFNGGRFELFAAPQLRHELPAAPSGPQPRLDTESEYFTEVSSLDPGLFSPTRIVSIGGLNGPPGHKPGCYSYLTDGSGQPEIDIATGSGTEVGITSGSTLVATQLVRDGVESKPRIWFVAPGAVYVATTAKNATLRISLNGSGPVAVCHR